MNEDFIGKKNGFTECIVKFYSSLQDVVDDEV